MGMCIASAEACLQAWRLSIDIMCIYYIYLFQTCINKTHTAIEEGQNNRGWQLGTGTRSGLQ